MPKILFIPDAFSDHRMWHGVPDRLRGRAEVVHLDQHAQIPWTAEAGGLLVDAVRRLAAAAESESESESGAGAGANADTSGGFDIVAAAGRSACFGFAAAEAGLARSLVLFYPALDRPLDEVIAGARGLELAHTNSRTGQPWQAWPTRPAHPWSDGLADPALPLTVFVAPCGRSLGQEIARWAARAEIIVASPRAVPVAEPGQSAEALLRMLDRLGC